MHRCSIIYNAAPGDTFNWDYYLSNHIPLAVGHSLRHSPVAKCELDRPLDETPTPPIPCVCSVFFERREGVDDFLKFLTSHADAREVRADEPNYTRIVPTFSAGEVIAAPGLAPRGDTAFRVRVIYSAGGTPFDGDALVSVIVPRTLVTLRGPLAPQGVEIDRTYGGLAPGSPPAAGAILSFYAESAEKARRLARHLETDANAALAPGSAADAPPPQIVAARIIDFDLDKTWR